MGYEIDLGMRNILDGESVPEDAFLGRCEKFILEPGEISGVSEPYHFVKFDYSLRPGIYFLFQDERMVYVGKATDLEMRLKQHYRSKEFNRVTYVTGIPSMFMEDVEAFYIHAATPDQNCYYPPKSRIVESMLGMIERVGAA